MHLANKTYAEIKELLRTNKDLIIPIGTCEQHGPHLPLNIDILCAEYFANVLSGISGSMIAPTVNYGINLPCDRSFTGTASISETTLKNIILEITDWWRSQGFERFFLITFHGDPYHLSALKNLAEDIYLIEPYEIEFDNILSKQATMRHACEAETSIALYLFPDQVRVSAIMEYDIEFNDFRAYLFHENTNQPDGYIGCLGYPKSATAEKGKKLVNRMKDKTIAEYRRIIETQSNPSYSSGTPDTLDQEILA